MIDWTLVLTPLTVLPIVVLFRFVGCAAIAGLEEPEAKPPEDIPLPERPPTPSPPPPVPPPPPVDTKPPNYRKYILGETPNPGLVNKNPGVVPNAANVIAYWRMVDAATSSVADDEKDFQNGEYKAGHVLPVIDHTPTAAGSEGRNPGNFLLGENSLIDSDPTVDCRYFNGGYVIVPYKPGLYSDQFTIEAWISTGALALDFDHTLFDAGGVYAFPAGSGAVDRGFRLYANRNGRWQVRMGPGMTDLFATPLPPIVPVGARTHVALTVENDGTGGVGKKVTLYVDGKATNTATVPSYAPPDGAPLYIGVENTANAPTANANLRNPVLCRIQEVVLHREALPKELIENHVDINR